MRRTRASWIAAASLTALLASPPTPRAETLQQVVDAGLQQLQTFLKEPLAAAQKAIGDLVAGARAKLPAAIETTVLKPALSWAFDRLVPAGQAGFAMLRRLYDAQVRGLGAFKTRVQGYADALDALLQKGAAAFGAAAKKVDGELARIVAFDADKALDQLKQLVRERASQLVRGRVAALLDQGLTVVVASIRSGLDKVYDAIRKVPKVGDRLAGLADDKVSAALVSLRDEGLTLALSKVESLASSGVDALFAAARDPAKQVEGWMQSARGVLQGLVERARGYAAQFKEVFGAIKTALSTVGTSFQPAKVLSDLKGKEDAKLVQAVASELKSSGDASAAAKALEAASAELQQAEAKAADLVAKAADSARSRCKGSNACLQQAIDRAKTEGEKLLASARAKVAKASEGALAKAKVKTPLAQAAAKTATGPAKTAPPPKKGP
jgi:hypothetical protein